MLFIDDEDIVLMRGVERVIHPAHKYEGNPVVSADRAWEEHLILGGTVRIENEGFRMWYQSYGKGTYLNLYAESPHGVHWTKPMLRQYEDFSGSLENNIFLSRLALRSDNRASVGVNQDHNPNVLYTPHLGQGRTYTLLSYDYARSGYSAYDGYFLAFSEDGWRWTDGPVEPVIPGHADVGWFMFDEQDKKFRAIVKNFLNIRGYRRRSVFWTESDDGLDWSLPRPAVIPDLKDEEWADGHEDYYMQFYGMPIFRYESMLLGFVQAFRCTDGRTSSDGSIDVQLVSSRDGRHWHRVGDRSPILERGPQGAWDWGMVLTGNSLVPDGDVVRIYFSGCNSTHGGQTPGDVPRKMAIGMASWPRDRFVGLRGGSAGGELRVTHKNIGSELHINANAVGGSLVAEIVFDGRPIPGFEASNCLPLTEDSPDHILRWRGDASLAPFNGKTVNINFKLTNAEIFSLW